MVVDGGFESAGAAVEPDEGQSMLLILVVGRFCDPVAGALDCPNDAMFLAIARLPHALALAAVLVRPRGVRGLVAGLRQWELQVRADSLPECFENLDGHPICGLPSGSHFLVSPDRLSVQHGGEQLHQSTARVMHACKWHVFIVKNSAH